MGIKIRGEEGYKIVTELKDSLEKADCETNMQTEDGFSRVSNSMINATVSESI